MLLLEPIILTFYCDVPTVGLRGNLRVIYDRLTHTCTQRPQTYTQLVVPPGTLLSHYLAIMLRRKSRNDVRLTRTSHIVDIVVDVTVNDAKCRGGKEVVAHTKHKKKTQKRRQICARVMRLLFCNKFRHGASAVFLTGAANLRQSRKYIGHD